MYTMFHYLPQFSLYVSTSVGWPLLKFRALRRINVPAVSRSSGRVSGESHTVTLSKAPLTLRLRNL